MKRFLLYVFLALWFATSASAGIIYTSATDTIEITGGSEATPYDLEDIYQADVAGSWGQASKQGSDQYLIDAHLNIGTGVLLAGLQMKRNNW